MLTVNPLNVDVNVSVEPWQNTAAYDTIPGAKIVFSRVNVGYSYASESVVTFTTKNLPPVSVSLSPVLYTYNSTGDPVSSKFDMTRTKINYSYDQDTGTGMGTLTIKRNKVSLADTLLLMAGGFAHTIAVEGVEFAGSNIYFDRVLEKFTFDDTPAPGCRAEHEKFQGASFIGVLYKGITPDIIFWPHVRVIENGVIFLLRSGSLHFLLLGEMMRI